MLELPLSSLGWWPSLITFALGLLSKDSLRVRASRRSLARSCALVIAIGLGALGVAAPAYAATFTVTVFTDTASGGAAGTGLGTPGDLRSAILAANAAGGAGNVIEFSCSSAPCTITLTGPLPPITANLTIDGGQFGDIIIDGASSYRVFFVDTGTVTIANLLIQNARAQGGNGGAGGLACGGGGAGLGAGLFVNGITAAATVTVSNVFFTGDSAVGGNGCSIFSSIGSGGGGGLGGNGGSGAENSSLDFTDGGGGGVLGAGASGSTSGTNGVAGGNGGGGGGDYDGNPSSSDGPGGAGYGTNSAGGNGAANGGNGGFGGGGGAGVQQAGNGGFGGGGGGAEETGGNGGPGGGGGGGRGVAAGSGGVLVGALRGGDGNGVPNGNSGGGAAAGPDIFVNQGTLITENSSTSSASATGGAGGSGAGNGTSDSTPVFNYAGVVNGSSTTGPIAGALSTSVTYVVTSTADSGTGSLRAELAAAAATGGTITFDSTVFLASNTAGQNTITLASSLAIPTGTTIQGLTTGSGATLQNLVTVSGGGSSSNFSMFTVASGITATISNLIVTNGYTQTQGGAIATRGNLTITECTFLNNYAAGVPSGGNGGGAIYSDGSLTVSDSTFSGNISAPGGAMNIASGTATIEQSTFSGNSAVAGKAGGAIFINNGTLTIAGSTFSGNSAASGEYTVFNNGTLTATNTIMAGNTGGDCGAGGLSSCPANGADGNIIGSSNINLAPLGSYGGPTQTMIPLPGSPAICAGLAGSIPSGVTTDQRGFPMENTTYPGYSSISPCVDTGAVQTNYALSFSTEPEAISPANSIVPNTSFQAAVTLSESGSLFTAANESIPLTLASTPSGATLSNGTQSTNASTGIVTYSTLQVSEVGTSDTLTANLTLTPGLTIAATSSQFSVGQITPVLSFAPSPATQAYSTAITSGSLGATASYGGNPVAGAFAYTTTVGGATVTLTAGATVLPVGSYTITATFTPSDTSTYLSASTTASYQVTQATPSLTWAAPAAIGYGTALTAAQLDAAASLNGTTVPGTFVYTPAAGTELTPGSYTLTATFTPTDTADYKTATVSVKLTVNGAALVVTANNATRTYGTANPTFTGFVSGGVNGNSLTESFTTSATVSSNAGTYSIVPSVTGAGLSDYAVTYANGTLTVTQATSTTSLSTSSTAITPGQNFTLTAQVASSTTGTPTGTVTFYDGTTSLGTFALSSGAASYSTASLAAGETHTFTASYSGDQNFSASSTSSSSVVTSAPLDFSIAISGPNDLTVLPGDSATYTMAVDPSYGSYAGTVSFAASGLPQGATATFSPSTIPANSGQQTVTVTIQTAAAGTNQATSSSELERAPLVLALLLLPLAGARQMRRQGRGLSRLFGLIVVFIGMTAATMVTGCGSPNSFFQAPQTYTVTITAAAGSVQHSNTVTLRIE